MFTALRFVFWTTILIAFPIIKMNGLYPSSVWLYLLAAVYLGVFGYCVYKVDDWTLLEAEEIKRYRQKFHRKENE